MIGSTVVALATLTCTAAFAADTPVSYFPVTSGSRPHDVAPVPDCAVWYSGQVKGYLGGWCALSIEAVPDSQPSSCANLAA